MRNPVFSNTYELCKSDHHEQDSAVAAMFEREAACSAVWDVEKKKNSFELRVVFHNPVRCLRESDEITLYLQESRITMQVLLDLWHSVSWSD